MVRVREQSPIEYRKHVIACRVGEQGHFEAILVAQNFCRGRRIIDGG